MTGSEQTLDIQKTIKFSTGKLISMSVASLLLFFSFMMSIFTPYPIGLSTILYGRTKGIAIAALSIILCFCLMRFALKDMFLFLPYILVMLTGLSLGEIVLSGRNPVRGIITITLSILVVMGTILFTYTQSRGVSVRQLMIQEVQEKSEAIEKLKKSIKTSGEQNAFEVEALLSNPEAIVDNAIQEAPGYFVMTILVFLWVNLFILLKSNNFVTRKEKFKYDESYLANFKVREHYIWIVIVGACFALWGDQLGSWYSTLGVTVLKIMGVFYFFQGFGIYLAFLDFLNLRGFFRTLMVVITIMSAGKALAFIGLFDMFVNFRKFFKKKNSGE